MGEPGQKPYAVIKPAEWNGRLVLDLDFNGWNARKEWFLGHCVSLGKTLFDSAAALAVVHLPGPGASPDRMHAIATELKAASTADLGAASFTRSYPAPPLRTWDVRNWGTYHPPAVSAQVAGASGSDPDVKEIVANARATVRDVTWRHGTLRPTNHFQESITVFLEGGRMRIVKLDGSSSIVTRKTGDVVAEPKGDPDNRDAVDAPVRAVVIDLHDNVVPGISNTSGYPDAFPRPGAKKVLETARIIAWDYTFVSGQPSPMHFHPRDVVTIYTDEGAVTSTNPEGVQTVNNHHPGEVVFNQRNRTHTEQLTRGNVHIIAVELK